MENKRRNAYDAAFKLKAINLRWDCESDNEEAEVSDKVLRLFNSDTEEDDFMVLVRRRKMKKTINDFSW